MAGTSVGGLVSGLDTASIISQLMQIEARPQTLLKNKATAAQNAVTALQAVNAKVAALKTAADRLGTTAPSGAGSWNASTVTSSSPSVAVASTGTSPARGSVTFDVLTTARAHSATSAEFSELSEVLEEIPPVITVTRGSVTTTIHPDSGSAADVAKAVREADIGLEASLMQVGPDRYRLVLTSTEPGAESAFDVTGFGPTTAVQGQDATLDLGNGIIARSPSGTFANLVPGTKITPTKAETGVTVTAGSDTATTVASVQALVDAANGALSDIATKTLFVPGGTSGVLAGDSLIRSVSSSLSSAVSTVGSSPYTAGIQLDRDGRLAFDPARLTALLESDPAAAKAVVSALADRLSAAAAAASDAGDGSITAAVTGRQAGITSLNDQVERWDTRLADRRTSLEKQYAALEVALGKLSSQSTWLSGQLASLSSS